MKEWYKSAAQVEAWKAKHKRINQLITNINKHLPMHVTPLKAKPVLALITWTNLVSKNNAMTTVSNKKWIVNSNPQIIFKDHSIDTPLMNPSMKKTMDANVRKSSVTTSTAVVSQMETNVISTVNARIVKTISLLNLLIILHILNHNT